VLRVNEPFRKNGIDYLIIMQGYSPNFVLYKNGLPVFDAFVALSAEKPEDSFQIPAEGINIKAALFPDLVQMEDGGVYSKSPRPRNPFYGLNIIKHGEVIYRGLLGLGKSVEFGEYRLAFPELREWVSLELVKETGIGVFFVISMIGLLGVLVRVLDPDRKIFVKIITLDGELQLTFYHFSKHFNVLLEDEVRKIVRQLKFIQ
jgi:cytochrome c biogenesis protein ResB